MPNEGNDVNRVAVFFNKKKKTFPDACFSRTFYQVFKSFITLVLCEKSK